MGMPICQYLNGYVLIDSSGFDAGLLGSERLLQKSWFPASTGNLYQPVINISSVNAPVEVHFR
jgi:hypothetical protein